MKTVVLATVTFAIFRAAPTAALTLVLAFQGSRRPDPLGDVVMAVYLAAVSSLLSTLGFLLVTVLSPTWRRLAPRRAVSIAGALGLVAPIMALVVTAPSARLLPPLFRSAPWLAIAIFHGLPGIALGLVALVVVRTWRPAPAVSR